MFISSVRIQQIARAKAPVRVQLADLTLDRYDTVEALDTAGFGYVYDPDDRGGTLTIACPLLDDDAVGIVIE